MYTPYVGEMNLHQSSIKFLHRESKLAEPPVGIQACENGDILWIYIYMYIWVNYNDPTATSLEIMVSKGNYLQMALIQVGEIL